VKAVIMAGGKGTRLRPLTSNQPKPMISIVNVPCMEHIVNLLKRHGFEDIVVTTEFLSEEIQNYFGDGSNWGVKMVYSVEEEPLGTAGSVKFTEDRLGERFIIVSGDALTDADLTQAVAFHEKREAEATLVLKEVEDPSEFGIVVVEDDGRVSRFLEKPDPEEVFSYTANTGIYVLEPGILKEIPEGEEYDFAKDLFPKLLEQGRPMYGFVMEGYWEDIGNIEQYLDAQKATLDGEIRGIQIPGRKLRDGVYVGRDTRVDEDQLEAPVVLGDSVEIASGARVGPHSVIASNVQIEAGASVVRSTVDERTSVGEEADLDGALVMKGCTIGPRARLLEGSALGDEVEVEEGATVTSGVGVYPEETIEEGARVTEDVGEDEA
jgi:mannose-1-phosphate guanylyltransferase / phosphomannomutase